MLKQLFLTTQLTNQIPKMIEGIELPDQNEERKEMKYNMELPKTYEHYKNKNQRRNSNEIYKESTTKSTN